MADRVTDEDLELLGELGVEITPKDEGGRTPREQRIIAGFEEIERFVDGHGHPPRHGEGGDIFERLADEAVDKPLFPGDRRLRVIFDNGTEASLWLRSLKRALYEEGNRKILSPDDVAAPLFADRADDGDVAAGSIYVLRSLSEHPFVAEHRSLIHKIGVTGGEVKGRLGSVKKDPTYLLADVEVVAEYKLANINRKGLEALLHKIFAPARLDLELKDRFGLQVEPREWFLVPLVIIDETIRRITDQTISRYRYDPAEARLISI